MYTQLLHEIILQEKNVGQFTYRLKESYLVLFLYSHENANLPSSAVPVNTPAVLLALLWSKVKHQYSLSPPTFLKNNLLDINLMPVKWLFFFF